MGKNNTKKNKHKNEYYKKQTTDIISRKKRINSIKVLVTRNNLSKALTEVNKYLSEYPNDSFGLFQHANILFLLGELEEAKIEFQYIID